NTALNSNEFFANAQGGPKPDIKLNQYGFEVGGPIIKNKTFFLGSWAGQQINFSQPIDQTYGAFPLLYTPTAAAGIFRYFAAELLCGRRRVEYRNLCLGSAGEIARPELCDPGRPYFQRKQLSVRAVPIRRSEYVGRRSSECAAAVVSGFCSSGRSVPLEQEC